jgi:hypothetical protein
LLQPDAVFAARVNQSAFTYPMTSIEFDGVTTGAYTDINDGMTVLFGSSAGADDYGRTRVRGAADSDTINIARSSIGIHDGEITGTDDAYITVLNDYRVWAKIPYIDDNDESFKDEIDWSDETTDIPPVANAGAAVFATIDGGSIITVDFDSADSFAVATGAALSSYLWDVDDGTITVGTSTSSAITATFPAGFRYVSLTVTDDNGKSHTTRVPVFARDDTPGADDTIDVFQIASHRITPMGQEMSLRIIESIPESTYPDGTLIIVADGEPASASDRSNLLMVGWHQEDPADIGVERTGILTETTFKVVDVTHKLDTLPAFPVSVEIANTPDKWEQMATPNMDKFIHYILQWHSTALDVADFTWSGTGTTMDFAILGTEGQSLYDTVQRKCLAIVPDYHFVCNTAGQMAVNADPILQETTDRTATIQATLTEADWADIRYEYNRPPRVYWLESGAAIAGAATPDATEGKLARAPGLAPGQGENMITHGEQLAVSQNTLNKCAGHRYARINSPNGKYRIVFAEGSTKSIEPANMTWVKLTITAAHAAQRGLAFTEERGLPSELNVRYNHTRTGMIRTVEMLWERETTGVPAVTYIPLEDSQQEDSGGWWDVPNYTPPESTTDWYDPVKGYVVWDNDNVGRTLDILASPVVWETINTGLSGTIIDIQYVGRPNGNETIGAWCLTSAGVFWCADIMAGTPSWSNTLSLATMQAAETAPDAGSARFASMFNHGARPGYLIVGTEPDTNNLSNINWPHAYFHFTDDYGATWTVQDSADELTRTTAGGTHGYCYHHKYAINWYRDTGGRIYALRATPRQTLNVETIIMYSDDDGATWVKGAVVPHGTNSWNNGALLNPFPAATDPLLVITGNVGASARPELYVSTDNGATIGSAITADDSHGFQQFSRLNSRTSDPDHIIGMGRQDSTGDWLIVASDDAGASWTTLHDTGGSSPQLETPNGWPADDDVWFTIRYSDLGSAIIWMTDDYFATGLGTDKTDNLLDGGVFGAWNSAIGGNAGVGGIALPKIGANA